MLSHQAAPAASCLPADEREQGTTYEPPRSIADRVRFAVGLCRSLRHHHADPSARAMCCDGFRHETVYLRWDNGPLKSITLWRPIAVIDELFPWEGLD